MTPSTFRLSVEIPTSDRTLSAQAQSTEVATKGVWIRARIALDRALGDLLANGISYEQGVNGDVK